MTNKDKFLKDGVSAREFIEALEKYGADTNEIKTFLIEQATPTLTEDERVILRNLNKEIYTTIGFDTNGLYLHNDNVACCREYAFYDMFGDLFQFIKERRRILY